MTPDDRPVFLCLGALDKKFRVAQMPTPMQFRRFTAHFSRKWPEVEGSVRLGVRVISRWAMQPPVTKEPIALFNRLGVTLSR